MNTNTDKRIRVPKMEGATARWYAKLRGSDSSLAEYRRQADGLTAGLPDGADILEVAPGPGYLAVELARSGRYRVTALDLSRTFVEMVARNARQAGVPVDVRHGNAEEMPLDGDRYDLVVCQAAFKNFARPVSALNEMYRVLRPGGTAVIQDMSHDVTAADIATEVRGMGLGPVNAFMTRRTLAALRLRAASADRFARLVADSAFGTCETRTEGITLEVRLAKPAQQATS